MIQEEKSPKVKRVDFQLFYKEKYTILLTISIRNALLKFVQKTIMNEEKRQEEGR